MPRPLVVGYGNSLRQDDGVGWHVAGELVFDPRFAGCDVKQEFQLLPELACDVAIASLVVLVDARESYDDEPGTVTVRAIPPPPPDATSVLSGFRTHHVTPEALLVLSERMGGAVPPVLVVEVACRDFDEGADTLSPAVAEAVPGIVDLVADLVAADAA